MNRAVIVHYDHLIDIGNDPARDPQPLREYMDKWDGAVFFDLLKLQSFHSVLEIGVGTGRLAQRIVPECGLFTGIDLSPKSIARARENLKDHRNVRLICADFLEYEFEETFDVICSSLTFMHIRQKSEAIMKSAKLLRQGGRAVISIDKSRQDFIDAGFGRLEIYPDAPKTLVKYFRQAGLKTEAITETEFAFILAAVK